VPFQQKSTTSLNQAMTAQIKSHNLEEAYTTPLGQVNSTVNSAAQPIFYQQALLDYAHQNGHPFIPAVINFLLLLAVKRVCLYLPYHSFKR
jgi:hypothetical protein